MLEAHAGVDHGDDSRVATDSNVPRLLGVCGGGLSALEVPLIPVQGVAGQRVRPAVPVGDRILDAGIRRQALEQRIHVAFVECAIELQHLRLDPDLVLALQAHPGRAAQLLHARTDGRGGRRRPVAPFHDDLIGRRLRLGERNRTAATTPTNSASAAANLIRTAE